MCYSSRFSFLPVFPATLLWIRCSHIWIFFSVLFGSRESLHRRSKPVIGLKASFLLPSPIPDSLVLIPATPSLRCPHFFASSDISSSQQHILPPLLKTRLSSFQSKLYFYPLLRPWIFFRGSTRSQNSKYKLRKLACFGFPSLAKKTYKASIQAICHRFKVVNRGMLRHVPTVLVFLLIMC